MFEIKEIASGDYAGRFVLCNAQFTWPVSQECDEDGRVLYFLSAEEAKSYALYEFDVEI